MPRYLTKAEVAQLLSVTERYVSQLAASGRLNALRLGHKIVRYKLSDVEALLNSGATIKD
jgi:excisionase family DNA binding protein